MSQFDSQLQRRIMGHFATGVTVVTTRRGEELCWMTANAVASLSLDPPLVLVAVDKRAQMHEHLTQARFFAVNILNEDQEALSGRFATRGPKEWSDLKLTTAVTGAPIIDGALAYLDCKLAEVLPGGDHHIFTGEIVAGDVREGRPLLYYRGKYARLAE
ncbi:MAG TPA: flavin reductase family protein [Pirellulales bacterium]|jgi:flavin reductase (DIM6/NTAB) family NADH-FMN oxidoreductase RutF|nr:flavin reductase family protein [Pirellulales bacterium]